MVRQDLLALDVVHDDVWHAENGPLVCEVDARVRAQVEGPGRVGLVDDFLEVRVAGEEERLERGRRLGARGRVGSFVRGRHGRAVVPPGERASERAGGARGGVVGFERGQRESEEDRPRGETHSIDSQGLLRVLASYAASFWSTET